MTNLEYLQKFITETYGALSFYNDPQDGYYVYPSESNKSVETLSIYFPNKLDLYVPEVKERIIAKYGKEVYDKYDGENVPMVGALSGQHLIHVYRIGGQVVSIADEYFLYRCGGVDYIIKYFLGQDISKYNLAPPYDTGKTVATTCNGFVLKAGDNIKEVLEKFLRQHNLPLINVGNGFFHKTENICSPTLRFPETGSCYNILRVREENYLKKYAEVMTEKDKQTHIAAMCSEIDTKLSCKNADINLEYLQKFITEAYGALCFYNDPQDGYYAYPSESDKSVETLSIYFPNKLDLYVPEVKERIIAKYGKEVYDKYDGENVPMVGALSGQHLIHVYRIGGQVVSIADEYFLYRCGGVDYIIKYFLGQDISKYNLAPPYDTGKTVATCNGFVLKAGDNIKEVLEQFLRQHNRPLINVENGFFQEVYYNCNRLAGFSDTESPLRVLNERRDIYLRKYGEIMTKEEMQKQVESIGVSDVPRTDEFDD